MADIFREGWTERIRYALTHDGVVLDLTGLTIALVGQDRDGNALTFGGTVGSDDLTGGIAYLDPAPTDLVHATSPWKLRWEITDSASKTAFFPRAQPLTWRIDLP